MNETEKNETPLALLKLILANGLQPGEINQNMKACKQSNLNSKQVPNLKNTRANAFPQILKYHFSYQFDIILVIFFIVYFKNPYL